jgi:anti-anti-sigma regulatory factor
MTRARSEPASSAQPWSGRLGRDRATGIIIDVAALDVLDSFATHTLRILARTASLRGAQTVIVGINPEVCTWRSTLTKAKRLSTR